MIANAATKFAALAEGSLRRVRPSLTHQSHRSLTMNDKRISRFKRELLNFRTSGLIVFAIGLALIVFQILALN